VATAELSEAARRRRRGELGDVMGTEIGTEVSAAGQIRDNRTRRQSGERTEWLRGVGKGVIGLWAYLGWVGLGNWDWPRC
jgi:hypothetical protein